MSRLTCRVEGCTSRPAQSRHSGVWYERCAVHESALWRAAGLTVRPFGWQEVSNPLVCICEDPELGPGGECRVCRRKPLAAFRLLQ